MLVLEVQGALKLSHFVQQSQHTDTSKNTKAILIKTLLHAAVRKGLSSAMINALHNDSIQPPEWKEILGRWCAAAHVAG